MNKTILTAVATLIGAISLSGCQSACEKNCGCEQTSPEPKSAFRLTSPDIAEGRPMTKAQEFNGFDADGQNISPELRWTGAPAGTKSFAITVYDPDAPTGSGWWHYVLVNLPASTDSLARSAGTDAKLRPAGTRQVRNDYGLLDFGGACPPKGDKPHRYIFTVHALKVDKLDLPADATAALAGFMINANSLGKATLTATYARPADAKSK